MHIKDISPHWFWLPTLLVAGQLLARFFAPEWHDYYIQSEKESGLVELLTPIALLPGIFFGLMALRLRQHLPTRNSAIWLGMVTLGAFYMAGEEISWGQWLFYWDTPDAFMEINDQQETNLHNTSAWLDQKPRLLLELWALSGALYAWRNLFVKRRLDVAKTSYWFWPTLPLAWTGLLSALVMLPERIKDWWGIKMTAPFDIRVTETQELVLAFFMSYFLVSAWCRLKSLASASH